jgi:hypothetical protein
VFDLYDLLLYYDNVSMVCNPNFGDGLMTNTFDDDLYVLRFSVFSLVNVKLSFSNSRSFSKVFHSSFLITTRNAKIPEPCSARDRAGRRAMRSITN